jgi:hypothetical protein
MRYLCALQKNVQFNWRRSPILFYHKAKHQLFARVTPLPFLGALEKFRKETFSSVRSVCLSVRTEQFGSRWTGFHEIWYLSIFRKLLRKFKFH